MIINWITENYIEVLGAITGLIYLYFSYNQNKLLWPLGLITSSFYILFFYNTKLYADMSLQLYYVVISIYGWVYWSGGSKSKKANKKDLPVRSISLKTWLVLFMITAILTLLAGFLLKKYTDAALPYLDAFTTAGGIVATWMLARKLLENWLFWIVVDIVASGMYFYKEKYPTLILYLIYSIIAIAGYYRWKKDLKKK